MSEAHLIDAALALYDQGELLAAASLFLSPLNLRGGDQFARKLYWTRKDIEGFVLVSLAIASAHGFAEPFMGSAEDLGVVKGLFFNIASFTWPGWDEPGITLSDSLVRLGAEAAQINLKLAYFLDKLNVAKMRAHWIVGAHLLWAGDAPHAKAEWERAAEFEVEEQEDAFLLEGYLKMLQAWSEAQEGADATFVFTDEDRKAFPDSVSQIEKAWLVLRQKR